MTCSSHPFRSRNRRGGRRPITPPRDRKRSTESAVGGWRPCPTAPPTSVEHGPMVRSALVTATPVPGERRDREKVLNAIEESRPATAMPHEHASTRFRCADPNRTLHWDRPPDRSGGVPLRHHPWVTHSRVASQRTPSTHLREASRREPTTRVRVRDPVTGDSGRPESAHAGGAIECSAVHLGSDRGAAAW
jgi:hypothetical protein